ncbi:Hypothetical protein A7982_10966 [Minicystis rosea]|nr:Hypothetical protein A7982_10966 [Minicystis rosea]
MVLAVMSTGCLITDPPQYNPPKHTRPFFDNATALPPLNSIVKVEGSAPTDITFEAFVFSQDDPVDPSSPSDFQQVEVYLYIDLGLQDSIPYRYAIPPARLAPGATLDQGGRKVQRTWRPNLNTVDYGCHTATLVAAHKFDDTPCPACADDSSAITWQILRCSQGDCNTMPATGPQSCEGFTNLCRTSESEATCVERGATSGDTQ